MRHPKSNPRTAAPGRQSLTGDPFRVFKDSLYSPHFQTYNRNKRSITLDTKDAARLPVRPAGIAQDLLR